LAKWPVFLQNASGNPIICTQQLEKDKHNVDLVLPAKISADSHVYE